MTNKEAVEILRKGYPDISTYPVNEYQDHHEDMALYNEAVDLAINALEKADFQDYEDKRQYSGERTWFDDCHPCTNCLNDECDGCIYALVPKVNQI